MTPRSLGRRTALAAVALAAVILLALVYRAWREPPDDLAREAAAPRDESLLDRIAPGGTLTTGRWDSARVLTQPVTLDTAPAPGFLQLRVPSQGAVLEVAFGINPERWRGLESGPFRFAIAALSTRKIGDRSERKLLLEDFVDPARAMDDRKWFPAEVDLGHFAGQDILLALSVSTPNLIDAPSDLAGWVEPRLVPRAVADRAPAAP